MIPIISFISIIIIKIYIIILLQLLLLLFESLLLSLLLVVLLVLLNIPLVEKVSRGTLKKIRPYQVIIRFITQIYDLQIFLFMWLREVCSFNYGILLGCIVLFNNYFWWQIHANRAILENLGSSSSPSYFTCLSSVALVFDPWFCQSVCLQS